MHGGSWRSTALSNDTLVVLGKVELENSGIAEQNGRSDRQEPRRNNFHVDITDATSYYEFKLFSQSGDFPNAK